LEEVVGLPDFDDILLDAYYPENQDSHFKEHFASQVALRRLTVHFHNTLRNGEQEKMDFLPVYLPTHLLPRAQTKEARAETAGAA
jgi:hypothetical protein